MNDVCATVGIENLKEFDKIIPIHRSNADYYDNNIKNDRVKLLKEKMALNHLSGYIHFLLKTEATSISIWIVVE